MIIIMWPKGLKHSLETKEKLRKTKLAENNPNWKGDNTTYINLHIWVRNNIPNLKICEFCSSKENIDLANITGIYNRDFENWKFLCRRCHMKSDGRISLVLKNLKQFNS